MARSDPPRTAPRRSVFLVAALLALAIADAQDEDTEYYNGEGDVCGFNVPPSQVQRCDGKPTCGPDCQETTCRCATC